MVDSPAAPTARVPAGRTETVEVTDVLAASDDTLQFAPIDVDVPASLTASTVSDRGSAIDATTLLAVAGPVLRTVRVQEATTSKRMVAGQESAVETSARFATVLVMVIAMVAGAFCRLPAPSLAPEHVAVNEPAVVGSVGVRVNVASVATCEPPVSLVEHPAVGAVPIAYDPAATPVTAAVGAVASRRTTTEVVDVPPVLAAVQPNVVPAVSVVTDPDGHVDAVTTDSVSSTDHDTATSLTYQRFTPSVPTTSATSDGAARWDHRS